MTSQQIRVNIKFINAECNDFGFDFDNYDNEFRNANVIDVVYKLIETFCTKNIHYSSIKKSKEADELIFLDANRKEEDDKINKENTFNDLSPVSREYTIYVVFRLLDKPLHESTTQFSNDPPSDDQLDDGPMTLSELAGPEIIQHNSRRRFDSRRRNDLRIRPVRRTHIRGRGKKQSINKNKKRVTKNKRTKNKRTTKNRSK